MVQLDDNDRTVREQRPFRAAQDFEIKTVDVDFHAVDPSDRMFIRKIIEAVEGVGLQLSFRSPHSINSVLPIARPEPQRELVDLGVLHVVVLEVLAQHRRRGGRLECEDTSLGGKLREEDGVVANIRANVEDPPVGPNVVDEPTLRLELA